MASTLHWSRTLLLAVLGTATASEFQIPLVAQKPLGAGNALTKPLVNTEDLQASIKIENLVERAKSLYSFAELSEPEYGHPTRVIGSKGHSATLEYIYSAVDKLDGYYTLSKQPFPAVMGNVFESRLVIGNEVPKSAFPMSLTPPTTNKQPVHGDLILVANEGCDPSDYPSTVTGNIAFVLRGKCSFGAKSELAGKAGAVAAIVYNYASGPLSGTLESPTPDHVATFGLSGEDAGPILKKLKNGDGVDSIAYIDSEVKKIETTNIIAQTVEGDPDNCVMLGGHSDSVSEGPGINDDGSGSLTLLEVATQLTKFSVNNCVRFAWWAGEEEGLLGSDYYVEVLPKEENLKIRLFMDYDMMGSPNFAYQVYNATNAANPEGSEQLRNLYVDWYNAHGLNHTFIPFDGRSDYDAFIRHGIPGGGIATGAEGVKTKEEEIMFGGKAGEWYDPCYHQLCDDVGNVNSTAWLLNTKLVAHSVATFAASFKGFPERSNTTVFESSEQRAKYHGHRLIL
ncbi:Zn-dependent exopeptidase [Daldinia caldariorum]|uniref:Zn-dependent exopeptidase n=1 Tax=Daldinia caldariorum TaxID=326644 RepID=UPI0020083694|nr:Zn-dependent exopeptidase [Daldinia caldariorum]KAI1467607.1 Zn-dependent exopeptidase [Daldinia caldariorum]